MMYYFIDFGGVLLIFSTSLFYLRNTHALKAEGIATKSSDFEEVLKTQVFIDRTMLIKDLFVAPNGTLYLRLHRKILMTAPHRFGKSTNLNMLKRFLEITVDDDGKRLPVIETDNYKLFTGNKLRICDEKEVIKNNLGQHPVLFVDFKPLTGLASYEEFLVKFQAVVVATFASHSYLGYCVQGLVAANSFNRFSSPKWCSRMNEVELVHGLKLLLFSLYRHFKKPVYILIDDVDWFVESLFFMAQSGTGVQQVFNFCHFLQSTLLRDRPHTGGIFLAGVVNAAFDGVYEFEPNYDTKIVHNHFLDENRFAKYFSLTSKELDKLLKRFVADKSQRAKTKSVIAENYGYKCQGLRQVYNLGSVLRFLQNGRAVDVYWSKIDLLKRMARLLRISSVKGHLLHALEGNSLRIDLFTVFTKHDLLILNELHTSLILNKVTDGQLYQEFTPNPLYVLLYYYGYLSQEVRNISTIDNSRLLQSRCPVTLPNREIKLVLAEFLQLDFSSDQQEAFYRCRNLSSERISSLYVSQKSDVVVALCKVCDDLSKCSTGKT